MARKVPSCGFGPVAPHPRKHALEGFTFQPSDDPTVEDDEYVCDADPAVTIQCCLYSGMFLVNEHGPMADFWLRSHSEHKLLANARMAAVNLAAERAAKRNA